MRRLISICAFAVLAGGCVTPGVTPSWFPAPDKPSGPKTAFVGDSVKFTTKGTDPLNVHLFQWDLGNGVLSSWKDDYETKKYAYPTPGEFEVRAREKCPLKLFQSDWSDGRKIMITAKPAAVGIVAKALRAVGLR